MASKQDGKISWGILGTGKIAGTFAKALQSCQTGTLAGIGSRSLDSANTFADRWSAPKRYGSYQALLDDPAIDAVYISLPNHLHKEWTIRCAEAGKHILCEKPLAVNYAEAEEAIAAVRKHDVFMMEAFMFRCHPQMSRLAQLLREGAIGKVRVIQAHFSYNMGGLKENIRQSYAAAGGAIMDVGCYTASISRLVAGAATSKDFANPTRVKGVGHIGEVTHVDEWSTAALEFPGDIIANLTCGIQANLEHSLRVWGSEGHIIVPNPWFADHDRGSGATGARILIYSDSQDKPKEEIIAGGQPLYVLEADIVAKHIINRQAPPPCMTWDDSLGNMATLDAWRNEVGLRFTADR